MITKFTSPNVLTKVFKLNDDGTIPKPKVPTLFKGTYETLPVKSLEDLKCIIEALQHNEALSHTTPEEKGGDICLKGFEDEEQGKISRTKDYFTYRPGPGVLLTDFDDNIPADKLIEMLGELYEPFKTTSYLVVTSASHGINEKVAYHIYFMVSDVSLIPQAMGNLFKLAFIKGYGYYKIFNGGSARSRTFFDKAVYDNARLDFIAGPVCNGFDAPPRDIRIVEKEHNVIKLDGLLEEVKDADKAMKVERDKVKPEEEKALRKSAKERGMSQESYKAALKSSTLGPDFVLPDGTKVKDILLESKERYEAGVSTVSRPICHPIEGGYEDKTSLFLNNNGCPVIHSFKHGGQTWKLQHDLETVGGNRTLKVFHELTTPENIEQYPRHEKTEKVLELMRETYKGRSQYLPEQTCAEMLDLYLHLVLDDEGGCYSLELRPSAGKTQTILHLAWWLGKHTDKSLSITFQQRKDIDQAYEFLKSKGINVGFIYSGNPEAAKEKDLQDCQIILHTHYRMRDNQYSDKYFRYKGKPRDLLIFDEAYFGTLSESITLQSAIMKLSGAITEEEARNLGLPLGFMKDLQKRLQKANRLLSSAKHPLVEINVPYLSERFIRTAWRANSDISDFLAKLFTIASAPERPVMKATRETQGAAMITYKVNHALSLEKMVTTDATRSIRGVHELSPQKIIPYPVDEPTPKPDRVFIVPDMLDSKTEALEKPALRHEAIYKLAKELDRKKVGYVQSRDMPQMPIYRDGIEFVLIPYGRHKQTNEFSDCDMIALAHQHRIPRYALKHHCMAEGQLPGIPDPKFVTKYDKGSRADESIQALMRGQRRKNKECPFMIFLKDEDVLKMLKDYFIMDEFTDWTTPEIQAEVKAHESKAKKREYDKKYANPKEKLMARKFREVLKKKDLTDFDDQRMMWEYLRDKKVGFSGGPATWLKYNLQSHLVIGEAESKSRMFENLETMDGVLTSDEVTLADILGVDQ